MRIAVLASGGLGHSVLAELSAHFEIVCVLTNATSESIKGWCETNQIPVFSGNPRKGKAEVFIKDKPVDVLVSVNYLFLIEKDLIEWPQVLAFNIHGSLLPKYRGRTPHVWSIINNEKQAGITAHLISEGCDTGDILEQVTVDILPEDTGADLLKKYADLYPKLLFKVMNDIQRDNFTITKQDESKATYFGKRTPDDGEIDWNWQKERINNWVRAQADPYPGAFSWLNGEKIIIDEVAFDDAGFEQEMENGLILSTDPFRVKTSNGVLRLTGVRNSNLKIKEQMKFDCYANR